MTITDQEVGIIASASASSRSASGPTSSGPQTGADFNWQHYISETVESVESAKVSRRRFLIRRVVMPNPSMHLIISCGSLMMSAG